jgi:hypothetical protein
VPLWAPASLPPSLQVGKLTVDALLSSGRKERLVVTPLQLDGEALTV